MTAPTPEAIEAAAEHADNMNRRHQIARAVSRPVGPWTAVEG